MSKSRRLFMSPSRARVYATLSALLLLGGIDLEMTWDSILVPFKPFRLVFVIVACAALATYLGVWLRRQLDEQASKRRFVLPFAIGFALLPVAGIGAHEVTARRPAELFPGLAELVLSGFALIVSSALGGALCAWVLVLVYYVRLAERTQSTDGPQLVDAAISAGLLGLSTLFSATHLLVIGLTGSVPNLIGQLVVWVLWGLVWFASLIWLALIVWSRARERRWLARVREGRDSDYDIVLLSEHPEWAKLPPYLTAGSYSGVLVYEPEDDSEERELLGRVE